MTATLTTLYGLKNCDTCRKARAWLHRFGIEHVFIDYRERPPAAQTLRAWARQAGGWDALVNKSSTTWRHLSPPRKQPQSEQEWTALIGEYPTLLRRPLLTLAAGRLHQGFSDGAYKKLFDG